MTTKKKIVIVNSFDNAEDDPSLKMSNANKLIISACILIAGMVSKAIVS